MLKLCSQGGPSSKIYDRNGPPCRFMGWFLNKTVRTPLIKGLGRLDWPKTQLKIVFQGFSGFWAVGNFFPHYPMGSLMAL